MNAHREILAKAIVPNGRWGDHHIRVERRLYDDGREEFVWYNGWDDPLLCTGEEDAMQCFRDRVAEARS